VLWVLHRISIMRYLRTWTACPEGVCALQLVPFWRCCTMRTRRTANQIYMLLIILLILSQDSSFNANVHKLVSVGCYGGQRSPSCPSREVT